MQPGLAKKAAVGMRFLSELEQGKKSLRLDKVNQVLFLFGVSVPQCNFLAIKIELCKKCFASYQLLAPALKNVSYFASN